MGEVKPRTLWSVRTRIAVACVCCAVIPLVAYATYTYVKTAHTLRDLEAVRLVEREVAVGRALDDLTAAALSSSADYASWPRLLAALGREDNTTVRRQLETLAASPGAVAQIYSTDGRLLVSGGGGAVQSSLWAVPEVKRLVTNATGGEPTAGFETVDGKLWVVSAEYAHRYGSTRSLGVLVTARPLDAATFASLDAATDVHLTQAPRGRRKPPAPPGAPRKTSRRAPRTASSIRWGRRSTTAGTAASTWPSTTPTAIAPASSRWRWRGRRW